MKGTFLDTSGLIALINTSDQWHAATEAAWDRLIAGAEPLTTTSLVLAELGDGLSRIGFRQLVVQLTDRLHTAEQVTVVPYDDELEVAARELSRSRVDKEWGVTDCASFAAMRRQGIDDAIATDHHFEQAGLRRLIATT